MSASEWEKFLCKFSTENFVGRDDIVFAEGTDHCPEVLQKLIDNNIQAVPVRDPASGKFVGLVDVLDFVATVVVLNTAKEFIDTLAHREIPWKEFFEQEKVVFAEQEVLEMCNASERNPWCPVHTSVPLHSLMDMFSKDVNLHRVPITDDDGNVLAIVSQSKVIAFLRREVAAFENVGSCTIQAADEAQRKVVSRPVISVNEKESAHEAFAQIVRNNVAGLAVINDAGELVGSLSASDIKGTFGTGLFADLNLSVRDYLLKTHANSLKPVSCAPDTTVQSVLEQLDDNHIHRVFVVDEANKPTGVLSLCDLISYLSLHFGPNE